MRLLSRRKNKFCISLALLVLFSFAFIGVCLAQTAAPADKFSIIWITDTQYLSESYPLYYDSLCRWIVENKETYNVKMVVHTGDMVEDEFNQTDWTNANHAMSLLLENGVPYCWNAGNHDYNTTYWIGNQYTAFNPSVMASKSYWVGDKFDGQNTAVKFSVSGKDFLVVNVAYQANETAIAWCNEVLNAYPNASAIVGAHMYLNTTGGYNAKGKDDVTWATVFKEPVLDPHSNVFLTLSAHYYPTSGARTQVGGRHELMFNRQVDDSEMGAASLRILTFDIDEKVIDVKTFVIYANTFLDDSNNQFTLQTEFCNSAIPEFHVWVIAVLSVAILPLVLAVKKFSRKQPVFAS
jgi:hypothetical protein